MKASELVQAVNALIEEHGDLDVLVLDHYGDFLPADDVYKNLDSENPALKIIT